jgi:AAA family ATP:ADP antiporter
LPNLLQAAKGSSRGEFGKAALLFFNFYLIIVTYSIIKPARGALVVTEMGAESLPYIWMITAATIGVIVTLYGRLIDLVSRQWVLAITTLGFGFTLAIIQFFLQRHSYPWMSGVLYVWGDIFSVVMIEQFWSFTNDLFDTEEAKRWYGFIGSGAVIGGITGSALTTLIVAEVGTINLLYVCEAILILLLVSANVAQTLAKPKPPPTENRLGLQPVKSGRPDLLAGFKLVLSHQYLFLILAFVLITQTLSTVLDFQFNAIVQKLYPAVDANTAFVSKLYIWISVASLVMMLFFIRPIHKYLGVVGGLLFLPITVVTGLVVFFFLPWPMILITLKSADKALNYSIHRVSKEMLYIPTSYEVKYKAKAVIDMFAYRLSKIVGSALIIPFISVFSAENLNFLTLALAIALIFVAVWEGRLYAFISGHTNWEPSSKARAAQVSILP